MSKQNTTYFGNTVKSPYVKIRKLCDYDYNCITVADLLDFIYVETVAELVAAVAAGGRIKLAPGTYTLTGTPLILGAGMELVGSGIGNTVITRSGSVSLISIADSNVTIQNLTLGTDTFSGNCISVIAVTQNIILDTVSFINDSTDPKINIAATTADWTVKNCIFNDTNDTISTINSTTLLTSATFTNNKFGVNPSDSGNSPLVQLNNLSVSNNNINDPLSLVNAAGDLTIVDNNIMGNISVNPISNAVVRQNMFLDNGDTGVSSVLIVGSTASHEILCTENIIRETTNNNLANTSSSSSSTNIIIKNNIIYDLSLVGMTISLTNTELCLTNNMSYITEIDVATATSFVRYCKNIVITKSTPGASSIALSGLPILSLSHTITVTADAGNSDDILLNNVASADGTATSLNFTPGDNAVIMWMGSIWIWIDAGTATPIA